MSPGFGCRGWGLTLFSLWHRGRSDSTASAAKAAQAAVAKLSLASANSLAFRPEGAAECACKRVESAGWKSLPRFGLDFVAEGNCVVARRGGEQPEANGWSVG